MSSTRIKSGKIVPDRVKQTYRYCLFLTIGFLISLFPFYVIYSTNQGNRPRLTESSIDLTYVTTSSILREVNIIAIKSWLDTGGNVIVFADNLSRIYENPNKLTLPSSTKLTVIEIPLPKSPVLKTPRLDILFESMDIYVKTGWICYIDYHVIVPSSFSKLVQVFKNMNDVLAIGSSWHCPVVVNNNDYSPCIAAKDEDVHDYFLFRKGLFNRGDSVIPPLWQYPDIWDRWALDKFKEVSVDITPFVQVVRIDDAVPHLDGKEERAKITEENANKELVGCSPSQKNLAECLVRAKAKYELIPPNIIKKKSL